jgi:hypothetical protein
MSDISEARLAANRENAQKSSGPVTPEGKAKSCLNAVKHGLTGGSVLFASQDEAQRYLRHAADYELQFKAVSREERALVQSIADVAWRLASVPVMELAIVALASTAIIDADPSDFWSHPANQTVLTLEARRRHEKELRNLQLQENRLARRLERETTQLRSLQTARKAKEEETLATGAKAALLATHRDPNSAKSPMFIPGLGFDFSDDRFQSYMRGLKPAQREILLQQALAEAPAAPQTTEAAA